MAPLQLAADRRRQHPADLAGCYSTCPSGKFKTIILISAFRYSFNENSESTWIDPENRPLYCMVMSFIPIRCRFSFANQRGSAASLLIPYRRQPHLSLGCHGFRPKDRYAQSQQTERKQRESHRFQVLARV
jgi:hypothetical protein